MEAMLATIATTWSRMKDAKERSFEKTTARTEKGVTAACWTDDFVRGIHSRIKGELSRLVEYRISCTEIVNLKNLSSAKGHTIAMRKVSLHGVVQCAGASPR